MKKSRNRRKSLPKSNSSPASQRENVRFPAATPDVILELVSSSRLAKYSTARPEILASKTTVAHAMLRRGIAITDALGVLRITNDDIRVWTANRGGQQEPSETVLQCALSTAMFRQADPRNTERAKQVVCADCMAIVEQLLPAASAEDREWALMMHHDILMGFMNRAEIGELNFLAEMGRPSQSAMTSAEAS